MANSLTKSGLTLGSKTANYIAEFNSEDFELMKLPLWSEVATATTGDIVIPDCIVDVDSFGMKYSSSSIISFKTGRLFGCNRVTSIDHMFVNCKNLVSADLSNFDTGNVTNMYQVFSYCRSLTSLDLSNLDTSNVTNMNSMFSDCSSLASLNLSNFDTSNVTTMSRMFYGCSSLTSLDLSSFNTGRVIFMNIMFNGCSSLTTLTLSSNWGYGLINQSDSAGRTLDLSTTAITKTVANDVLSKLANVTGGKYQPIVKFKSSLGLSSTETAVGTNKGWDVQTV